MDQKALEEAVKDILRLVVFAIPGIAIQVFTTNPGVASTVTGSLILLALRAIDSYIHNNKDIKSNGLTPF